MQLHLYREPSSPSSTLGTLYVDGVFECYTLEDIVRSGPKVYGKTAIPSGTYSVVVTYSNRFKRQLPLLPNVPNFEGIRIHPGNTAADTLGCILVGRTRKPDFVGNSRDAFKALFAKIQAATKTGKVTITIENAPKTEKELTDHLLDAKTELATGDTKALIERVINVFETGTPDGRYDAMSFFHDGPHDIKQITYGRSQTTEYGNLRSLVDRYVRSDGMYRDALAPYIDKIGAIPLVDDADFKALLRQAARTDPIMRTVQDEFFDEAYFLPAMRWAKTNGFTLPLSALVIYDSFIHSGSILWLLRKKFAEAPPANGGDERAWIKAYVNARHQWLSTHRREILRKTIYRTQCFRDEMERGNWDLSKRPVVANGVNVNV